MQTSAGRATNKVTKTLMAMVEDHDLQDERGAEEPTNASAPDAPMRKKRRTERRQKLRKTLLCKHFDKPGGCPFPDCRFAHGNDEMRDGGAITVAAQRQLIRDQAIERATSKFTEEKPVVPYFMRTGTMIERYYTELYALDVMEKPKEDQYVYMHSNRLCVIGIAPSHVVFQSPIVKVEFQDNILDSKVSGKKKKGGQWLHPHTVLCHVETKNGIRFALRSCIRGALLEVNERLLSQPQLLQSKPLTEGFLAIIQPKPIEVAEIQHALASKAEYMALRHSSPPDSSLES